MQRLVSVDEIRSAAARLDGVIVRTPLVPFPRVAPRLLIKPESLQPTGAFKLRGAYAASSALPAAVPPAGTRKPAPKPSSNSCCPRAKPHSRST